MSRNTDSASIPDTSRDGKNEASEQEVTNASLATADERQAATDPVNPVEAPALTGVSYPFVIISSDHASHAYATRVMAGDLDEAINTFTSKLPDHTVNSKFNENEEHPSPTDPSSGGTLTIIDLDQREPSAPDAVIPRPNSQPTDALTGEPVSTS